MPWPLFISLHSTWFLISPASCFSFFKTKWRSTRPKFAHFVLYTFVWFFSFPQVVSSACNPWPLLPPLQQTRLIVWLYSNSKNLYLMIHIRYWVRGMALCTSAIGMESHAAVGTKGSQAWTSRATINISINLSRFNCL